jgi:hypothetical protein
VCPSSAEQVLSHYETFNVDLEAPAETILSAYRRLRTLNGGNTLVQNRLEAAYNVLADPGILSNIRVW